MSEDEEQSLLEQEKLLEKGREGDLEAIASLLKSQLSLSLSKTLSKTVDKTQNKTLGGQKANGGELRVQVSKRNQYLGILLEADLVPDCEIASQIVGQLLAKLKLKGINGLKIFGRTTNVNAPIWRRDLELVAKAMEQDHLSLLDWLSQGTSIAPQASNSRMLSEKITEPAIAEGRRYLRFYFSAAETALLPLDRIDEVLQVTRSSILPMPNMPDSVGGICNCRGGMLWLVDLGLQLGFPSSLAGISEIVAVVVVRDGDRRFGLAVPHIVDIESYLTQDLRPPSKELFSANLLRFMEGYLTRSSSPVLDVRAIACDSRLQVHLYAAA